MGGWLDWKVTNISLEGRIVVVVVVVTLRGCVTSNVFLKIPICLHKQKRNFQG